MHTSPLPASIDAEPPVPYTTMPPLFEYPEVVSLSDDELIAGVAQASEAHTTAIAALKDAQATEEVEAIAAAEEHFASRPARLRKGDGGPASATSPAHIPR
jgi:hypothetical protein